MSEIEKQGTYPPIVPSQQERQAAAASTVTFVPPIKLLQGLSSEANEGNNSAGDFYYKQDTRNLGTKIKIIVLGRRSHAILFVKNVKEKESFDINSPIYKDIKNTRRAKGVSPLSGHDFCLYIPEHELFTCFHFGKRSHQDTANEILDCMIPPTERPDTKLCKERLYTRYFELYSFWKEWSPDFKAWIPRVTPLVQPEAGTIAVDVAKIDKTLELFYSAVSTEGVVEEADTGEMER